MPLFNLKPTTLHSGAISPYVIDCTALTEADWECLAYLLVARVKPFTKVEGVPRGGLPLAKALESYAELYREQGVAESLLIVDDVYTTGNSLREHQAGRPAQLAVAFARQQPDPWVTAVCIITPHQRNWP